MVAHGTVPRILLKLRNSHCILVVAIIFDDANGTRAAAVFVTRYESVAQDLSRKNADEDLARVFFFRPCIPSF